MICLVVGADRVDAGKTTFSVGLLERTGAVGYKPRAGNDYWFDHDDCRQALDDGRLYGKDAARLTAAEDRDRPPELLNPIHRLWQPSPRGGTGLLGRDDREFVVDRVRTADGDHFVVNAAATIPDPVAESLPVTDATTVETTAELNDVMEAQYVPTLQTLTTEIEAQSLAVVESYSDVALPLEELVPTIVAAVEPRRVRLYRGDRYHRACQIARSSPHDGSLEKRVPDVLDYLEPVDRVSLPALGSDARRDPSQIETAYESAYDALLSAV